MLPPSKRPDAARVLCVRPYCVIPVNGPRNRVPSFAAFQPILEQPLSDCCSCIAAQNASRKGLAPNLPALCLPEHWRCTR